MLTHTLIVTHPFGSATARRRDLARTFAIVVLTLGALAGLNAATRRPRIHACAETDRDAAVRLVRMYAFEAYPSWVVSNPALACPTARELHAYSNAPPIDPWGTVLRRACHRGAPLRVISAGEDGRFDTSDDISSDDVISTDVVISNDDVMSNEDVMSSDD